jgi:hypothetical protein
MCEKILYGFWTSLGTYILIVRRLRILLKDFNTPLIK